MGCSTAYFFASCPSVFSESGVSMYVACELSLASRAGLRPFPEEAFRKGRSALGE